MEDDFNFFANNSKAKDFWDDEFGDDLILEVTQDTEPTPNHQGTTRRNIPPVMERSGIDNDLRRVEATNTGSGSLERRGQIEDEMAVPMEGLETGDDMTAFLEDDVAFENLITSTAITDPDVIRVERGDQLTNELLNVRVERDEFKAELLDLQTRFETTVGENTMLRSALTKLQEQMQTLKLQRIMETEANRQELQSQVDKLTKDVEAKSTELRLKLLQCTNARTDLQQTDREPMVGNKRKVFAVVDQEQEIRPHKFHSAMENQRFRRHLMRIHGLDLHLPETVLNNDESVMMGQEMEELILDTRILNERRQLMNSSVSEQNRTALFRRELETISLLASRLESSTLNSISSEDKDKDMEKWIDICLNSMYLTIPEFILYIRNRELHSSGDENKSDEGLKSSRNPRDHHQQRIIVFRHYINVMATLCRMDIFGTSLVENILRRKFEERYILEWMMELLTNVPSRNSEILAAIGLWLRNIIQQMLLLMMKKVKMRLGPEEDAVMDHQLALVIKVLKQLLTATVPVHSIRVIHRLVECFLACIRFPKVLPLLCPNDVGPVKDSMPPNHCSFMTFANLMISNFSFSSQNLQFPDFEDLVRISLNYLNLIYYRFIESSKFIGLLTPVIDEHIEEKRSSQSNSDQLKVPINCECYISLCLSVITLLHYLLKRWLSLEMRYRNKSLVSRVACFGIHIVYLVFSAHYITCLLREAEENTKYQLTLVCKWLLDNSSILALDDLSVDLLKRIEQSHLIPTEINSDANNLCTIQADLSEWQRLSGDQLAENLLQTSNKPEENLHSFEATVLNRYLQFDVLQHLIIND